MTFSGPTFLCRRENSGPRLLADLARILAIDPAESLRLAFSFSDSFDWALYRAGWALEVTGSRHRLVDRAEGGVLADAQESTVSAPRFAWDFTDSALQDMLAPALKARSLIRLVAVRESGRRFTLRDAHGDVVARCDLTALTVMRAGLDRPLAARCSFSSLPEDSPWAVAARGLCAESGWVAAPPALLDAALACAGIRPGAYCGRVRVALTPQTPAGDAVRLIARGLRAVMRANLPGLRRDVDTEFLHDFRVSVRRTRSLVRIMDGALSDPDLTAFGPAFRAIGRATGELRDLDVTLLRRREYARVLPDALQPGLDRYFGRLAASRERARQDLLAFLDGPDFQQTVRRWDEYLAGNPGHARPEAEADGGPIAAVARREIRRYYRQVLRRGARIAASSPDRTLHRLRIACKRLRYALEFFGTLFPGDAGEHLVDQLKALQDNLGEHNDLSVHLARLLRTLEGGEGAALSSAEAAAVGALMLHLQARRTRVREEFTQKFAAFAGKSNRRLVKSLV